MKAVVVRNFAPVEMAEFAEVDEPPCPAAGEVIVDVVAAEVNFPDLLVMEGRYQIKPPLPFSPGKAAAGRIAAVGEGVEGLEVGVPVSAQVEFGAYAQKLRAPAQSCFALPAAMPFEVGAALGLVYQTAHFALLERARFTPGESVLVLGASGGIGSASVQLAKAMGASTVIGGARGVGNLEVAREVGCDYVIDLAMDDLHTGVREGVRACTGGRGVDIVIDPVGGETNTAALRAMAWCGRLVVVGFASGDIPAIKANYLLVKNIAVSGLQWSDYRDRQPERVQAAQKAIFSLWEQRKLNPHISKVLSMECFAEALATIRDGRVQGKIILTAPH